MASDDIFAEYFSKERVLKSTPPTHRANALLFQIESLVAHLVSRSRQITERFLTERIVDERELRFLEAYNLGKTPPLTPTIIDLEYYAREWEHLVPDRDEIRAALIHRLSGKYSFLKDDIPTIRQILQLDMSSLQSVYRQFYEGSVAEIYKKNSGIPGRLRRHYSKFGYWLESLPQFWSVFALTLTETVGASILALPIALASIGVIPGLVLLIIFGICNVLTIAYMAEAASRTGSIRYGNGFMGEMVSDYLGKPAGVVLSIAILAICALAVLAYYVGFATTLASTTGIPSLFWVIVLFVFGLYFITRGSLNATVSLSLVVGTVNILMIVVLTLLAFPHTTVENFLFYDISFLQGGTFDISILELVFGIILAAFFGHLSVPNSAKVVLKKDPTGGDLVRGAMAAQIVAIFVNCLWVSIVNSTIHPQSLAKETGTSLIPLAKTVGPSVDLFGTIFIVLGLGMVSIHLSLALFNLTREWIPNRQGMRITLPVRRGWLSLTPKQSKETPIQVGLHYLGKEDGEPKFRFDLQTEDKGFHFETVISNEWKSQQWLQMYPELQKFAQVLSFSLELLSTENDLIEFRFMGPQTIKYHAQNDQLGLSVSDLLTLPENEADFFNWMMRTGSADSTQIEQHMEKNKMETQLFLQPLIDKGAIKKMIKGNRTIYSLRMGMTRSHRLSESLSQEVTKSAGNNTLTTSTHHRHSATPNVLFRWHEALMNMAFGERGGKILGLLPLVGVFIAAELLLILEKESFSGPLGFIGVVVVAMMGGIFPVLLLAASRKKGDVVPKVVYRWLGHPVFLFVIYFVSLTGVILHGLFIWENTLMRILALGVALIILIITVGAWRKNSFTSVFVVTLYKKNEAEGVELNIMVNGKNYQTDIEIKTRENHAQHFHASSCEIPVFEKLEHLRISFPSLLADNARIITSQFGDDGQISSLPMIVKLNQSVDESQYKGSSTSMFTSRDGVIVPLSKSSPCVTLLPVG
ncbi:MAG: hypothetical protein GKR95_08620 [Gammaproteobacteria bacterium]|nr:hypothetical protein [Gammaproteobacteria bacterium]